MEKREEGRVIPIIDLQESPFPYAKLREACEKWGCFRVVNHNVPKSTMSEMKSVSRSLLDLPAEVKDRNTCTTIGKLGYVPLGSVNSIYEALGLADPTHAGAIDTFCSQLYVSSNQREIIEKYVRAVNGLLDNLMDKISKSVGLLSPGNKDMFKDWLWNLRMNKYNFTSQTLGSYGGNLHTDPGFLTLLQDDEVVGGLEVVDEYGSFITVEPSPGNFFVNIGDLGAAWSNGRFNSLKHCVRCKEESVRVSIVAFMLGPPGELAVEAPEELVDNAKHPRLYAPIKHGPYTVLRRANKMVCGEALSLFRLQS